MIDCIYLATLEYSMYARDHCDSAPGVLQSWQSLQTKHMGMSDGYCWQFCSLLRHIHGHEIALDSIDAVPPLSMCKIISCRLFQGRSLWK